MVKSTRIIILFVLAFGLSVQSYSQLFAPVAGNKKWVGTTQYLSNPSHQDSIFVFFSSQVSPAKGILKAKFSDGAVSTFSWYKYNNTITIPANRFELISTETNVAESVLPDLDRGGYRVKITNSADSTEIYTAWVFIDNVEINSISIYRNSCVGLTLDAITTPNWSNVLDQFTYWDLSRTNHPEINKYGSDYFKNISWTATDPHIVVPPTKNLRIIMDNPPPFYNSSYSIKNTNPFGRVLSASTAEIVAKAVKADFSVRVSENDRWIDLEDGKTYEAPLSLEFKTKSINADIIKWSIINDDTLFLKGGDSVLWSNSYPFALDFTVQPEIKLIPGKFPLEQKAISTVSGCRDSLVLFVEVEKSMIDVKAIPNVFTPNGDSYNDYFKFSDTLKIKSIKHFNIYILSRWGNLVYEYHGDPKTWEGWNGQFNGNKGDVPEGVYYYVIEAIGWDNKKFKGGKYKGFLHLFRGRN